MLDKLITRVDELKESGSNLENALMMYYEELIRTLLNKLSDILASVEKLPKLSKSIPIVLAGGTCLPNGFKAKFEQLLKEVHMPIGISSVRLANDPLRTTTMGALISASVRDDNLLTVS